MQKWDMKSFALSDYNAFSDDDLQMHRSGNGWWKGCFRHVQLRHRLEDGGGRLVVASGSEDSE
jgi:hypothetical protein